MVIGCIEEINVKTGTDGESAKDGFVLKRGSLCDAGL